MLHIATFSIVHSIPIFASDYHRTSYVCFSPKRASKLTNFQFRHGTSRSQSMLRRTERTGANLQAFCSHSIFTWISANSDPPPQSKRKICRAVPLMAETLR